MDLLRTAVVDITILAATCRALKGGPPEGELRERRKLRVRLRTELRLGSVAYINALARSKRGEPDEDLLALCRVAAERQMPRALRHEGDLKHLMTTGRGALDGLAAARQDLWRLVHMLVQLRKGLVAMHAAGANIDDDVVKKVGRGLRRRLRRALIAYARAGQRDREDPQSALATARKAALGWIGKRAVEEADQLGRLEAQRGADRSAIRQGVVRPLNDLVADWSQTA
jgi:hypothetical protein